MSLEDKMESDLLNGAVNRLAAKVKVVNRCNAEAKKLFAQLHEIFEPFVGQKIEKADGGLMEKVKKLLPELPNTYSLGTYKLSSPYSLGWNVKSGETVDNRAIYHDVSVYIGTMSNGVLTGLYDSFDARDDYTVEEIANLRADYKIKKKAAEAAESKLFPFGEIDR